MSEPAGPPRKPGTRTMTAGLCLAGLAFGFSLVAFSWGAGPSALTIGALGLGLAIAVVGFARRVLADPGRRS
ncbi:hypothetical protein [Arthrobacter sp. RIT-PI-e]|uniref:hypothetical protein n=1 Tax=Arthrobacter sp. RIT-PI-e TaxID=1681197 RepID=UPI00128F8372|nr:hypothetical protein [Arthrobacter sp. RIT-PI-e]